MAKIAFFCEHLPSDGQLISKAVYSLIRGLSLKQHSIILLTSTMDPEEQEEFDDLPVQVLFPFKKWSILELPKCLPALLDFKPDIIHVIQPKSDRKLSFSHLLNGITSLKPLLGHPPVVISFFDSPKQISSYKNLLSNVDSFTVSSREIKKQIGASLSSNDRVPEAEVIPAFFLKNEMEFKSSWISDCSEQPVLIFGDITESIAQGLLDKISQLVQFSTKLQFFFVDGWGQSNLLKRRSVKNKIQKLDLEQNVFVASDLDEQQKHSLITKALTVIFTSPSKNPLETTFWADDALSSGVHVIMSQNSKELLTASGLPTDGIEAYQKDYENLPFLVTTAIQKKEAPYRKIKRSHLISDYSTNLFSRLYMELTKDQ